jgi:ribosomal protein S18 acetylase RimI-like enzyme
LNSSHSASSAEVEIISLTPDHWEEYRDLRLQALREEPHAFASSYEEIAGRTENDWKRLLKRPDWFIRFARSHGQIIGSALMIITEHGHLATLNAVYVAQHYRGRGTSRRLLEHLLADVAAAGVPQVELNVNQRQAAAVALYQSLGFETVETINSAGEQSKFRMRKTL